MWWPTTLQAYKAGGPEASKCTLILTEGDSAKVSIERNASRDLWLDSYSLVGMSHFDAVQALAVAGLAIVGRDYYGVFPLRGKLLNVRDASPNQVRPSETFATVHGQGLVCLSLRTGCPFTAHSGRSKY